ncbi:ATP-binding cassette domain-containing protein [Gluconacetobacter sacchari]|uniref:ATP-binding cassette domain-containing protein n=1 Tax=Gluconacetobacter sacchari TaxID=92759 RepID=UPI0039B5983C
MLTGDGSRQLGRPLTATWARGQSVIFFGPSGAGKSTLGRALAGLSPAMTAAAVSSPPQNPVDAVNSAANPPPI